MSITILNFLQTGKLGSLEVGMSLESAIAAVPSLVFYREDDGVRVYDTGGDLQLLALENDRVFGLMLHLPDKKLNLPPELEIGKWTIPRTTRAFLKMLDGNNLVYTPYLDILGRRIGVRLESRVVVKFDGEKLHSIQQTAFHDGAETEKLLS